MRILPALHSIVLRVNTVRFGAYAIRDIHRDWTQLAPPPDAAAEDAAAASAPPLVRRIVVENVSFTYEKGVRPALADVNLQIECGESVGIVGATGAGKTTLVDILLGLLEPSAGRVLVDGRDIRKNLRAWQRQLGYVPQAIYLADDTIARNVALGLDDETIDRDRVAIVVHMAQLEPFMETLPKGLDTLVGERGVRLSGGQRQRVAIARAIYHDPQVLFFDEATAALDNQTEQELTRSINALQGQKTLIIVAHRLTTVRNCDRLFLLDDARLVDVGSYDELGARSERFRTMAALPATAG